MNKVYKQGNFWIPESEMALYEKLQKEMEQDFWEFVLGIKPIPERDLTQEFVFVNLSCYPGLGMERKSDKQIFEMSEMGVPDLSKPVNRKYFERYSRGMDI